MGIPNRLFRLAKAYVNDWLNKDKENADFDDDIWEDFEREERQQQRRQRYNRPRDPKIVQYYERLNIPYDSDYQTVREAWKRLMKKYHPDKYVNDPQKIKMATKISQELTEAYKEIEKYLKLQGRA